MYQVGDRIVYPMYGAGIVNAIEDRVILGKKQQYYVMNIAAGDMKVMIPVQTSDVIGVRPVIDTDEAMRVLESFRRSALNIDSNWNKRHRDNTEKIKSGDIYKVCEVVKDLMYREKKKKGLSTSERRMFNNAKQILVSELVLSGVADEEDICSILEETVNELIRAEKAEGQDT